MSLSDIPSCFSCATSRLIVVFSSRETRSDGKLKRRLPQQLIEELPAHRLALLGPQLALQGLVHGLAQSSSRLSKLIESRNA